jgi:hypothetical protein
MDLSAVITRGFTASDPELWLLVTEQGACSASGLSPDAWYPAETADPADPAKRQTAAALAVCGACRVRQECLELSLRNWTLGQHGVWGGTVPAERERLRVGRVAQLLRALARSRDADRPISPNAARLTT